MDRGLKINSHTLLVENTSVSHAGDEGNREHTKDRADPRAKQECRRFHARDTVIGHVLASVNRLMGDVSG
jgi:hypothetical protein